MTIHNTISCGGEKAETVNNYLEGIKIEKRSHGAMGEEIAAVGNTAKECWRSESWGSSPGWYPGSHVQGGGEKGAAGAGVGC